MSSPVNMPCSISDQKWDLALRLSGRSDIPERILKRIFDTTILGIEMRDQTKFTPALRDRVWSKVSGEPLAALQIEYFTEFCTNILDLFTEDDVGDMLAEHQQDGSIHTRRYAAKLVMAHRLRKDAIMRTVQNKAISIERDWAGIILRHVRNEGIV